VAGVGRIATGKVSQRGLTVSTMNIQLICPWCEDEVRFEVDEAEDELECSACGTRMAFAPDPVATFSLIYEAA
jgi:DNA-directed RNA polymerase subunit RPC12/RpoP